MITTLTELNQAERQTSANLAPMQQMVQHQKKTALTACYVGETNYTIVYEQDIETYESVPMLSCTHARDHLNAKQRDLLALQ